MTRFLLANPAKERLDAVMGPVARQWEATSKEPVPRHLLDLLAKMK